MSDMRESLNGIREDFDKAMEMVKDSASAEKLSLGPWKERKKLTSVLREMGGLSAEERPVIGKAANEVRTHMENKLADIAMKVKEEEKSQNLSVKSLMLQFLRYSRCRKPSPAQYGHK